MVLDVRKRQKDALVKLLHLNESAKRDVSAVEAFKVLVIDDASLKIVATLLHTEALRQHGVTLVLAIDREREAIADAPVVYFVRSSQANTAAIVRDLESSLYKEAHINFVSWAPRDVLEALAAGTVKAAATATVAKVYDQYLSFIALEPDLFTLSLADSYVHLNDNTASEADVAAAVEAVVEGLFSVCVTLAAVPKIRCVPGGLAEAVARGLSAKIAGHLRGRGPSLFADTQTFIAGAARPLLCLFDRNFDLTPMVEQPFTYKALVHDCQGLALNKVELEQGGGGEGGGAARKVTIEIGDDDAFWQQNGHQEFGIVASSIDEQLKKYQEVMTSLSKRNFAGDAESSEADAVQEATRALMTTVKSLPELRAQKRKLDNHMNLLYGLLTAIKERTLDKYHELGQSLLSGSAGLSEVQAKLAEGAGSAADKLRLATLFLLLADKPPAAADTQALADALRGAGADEAAFNYVVRMKQMNLTGGGGAAPAAAAGGSKGWAMPGIDASLVSGIAGQFSKQLTKLVGGTRQAQLVTAVSQLLDGGGGGGRASSSSPTPADTFLLIDPKQEAGKGGDDAGVTSAREAIVFMIGGGNYLERERLAQWAAQCSPRRRVVYGATELLTGEQFCAQLALLGRKSAGTAA